MHRPVIGEAGGDLGVVRLLPAQVRHVGGRAALQCPEIVEIQNPRRVPRQLANQLRPSQMPGLEQSLDAERQQRFQSDDSKRRLIELAAPSGWRHEAIGRHKTLHPDWWLFACVPIAPAFRPSLTPHSLNVSDSKPGSGRSGCLHGPQIGRPLQLKSGKSPNAESCAVPRGDKLKHRFG